MNLLASALAIVLLFSADTARQTFEAATQALNSGDYPAAEAGFNKVLEMDPRNVSALANLGVLVCQDPSLWQGDRGISAGSPHQSSAT